MTVESDIRGPIKRLRISPLRYPGGKSSLYTRLRKLIRYAGLAGGTYVEPYAGGAGVALGLLVTGQVKRIIINDLDRSIYAFWKTLVNDPDFLISRIEGVSLDVNEWRKQREIYLSAGPQDTAELGFATFYLNRTNRSGVLNGGPIGGLDQSGSYKIDARFNRGALVDRVRTLALYSDFISVSDIDGSEVVEKYASHENVFIYADPPYFEKSGTLYLNAFAPDDHAKLAGVLNNHRDRNWLLTYDNSPKVSELYPDRRRREFGLNYSAHRVMKAKEIAVLSDSIPDIGTDWAIFG